MKKNYVNMTVRQFFQMKKINIGRPDLFCPDGIIHRPQFFMNVDLNSAPKLRTFNGRRQIRMETGLVRNDHERLEVPSFG